jgi:hypothetical protein
MSGYAISQILRYSPKNEFEHSFSLSAYLDNGAFNG